MRPAEYDRDFGKIALLFSIGQGEPTSEAGLKLDYKDHKGRLIRLMVAEDEQGELLGFNWVTRSRFDANQAYFYLVVSPGQYGQGVGRQLYADLEAAAQKAGILQLHVDIRDDFPQAREFVQSRGFIEQAHYVKLGLNLEGFEEVGRDAIIDKLKYEGFLFTSMQELGDTEAAQRKLYQLNDTTNMELVIPKAQHIWLSFADFKQKVCRTDWYKPAGQLIAIDRGTGLWAAMSAITRFEGADYANNLHTGVDKRYHGRKLAQAMLLQALRYARETLKVTSVHADENADHISSLAIYHELGYTNLPGIFSMEKSLQP